MSRRPSVTARQVAAASQLLSATHHAVLADVGGLRVLTGGQLRRLHYGQSDSAARAARRDLERLTALRVLDRLDRRIGGINAGSDGTVYAAGLLGQRLLAPERRRWWPLPMPTERTLAHRLATSELYVQLREREANGQVELVEFQGEPACWRSFIGPGGGRLTLKPDAAAIVAAGDYEYHWFIEVDRATESLPWIATKAKAYVRYWQSGREQARNGLFPRVLWVAPTDERAAALTEALADLPADQWQLFGVTTDMHAASRLAGGTTSTNTTKEVTP